VRKLLVVVGVLAVVLPLLSGPLAAAQEQAQGQRDGAGNPIGVLGPVNALGQEVKRPPAPTGPPPRLPDGTIDLGDGAWVAVPGGGDSIAQRLSRGEELPLLPAAKALMASRQLTDDPVNWCLPLGLLRTSPYPFRFIQNYPAQEANAHVYPVRVDGLVPPDLSGRPQASRRTRANLVRSLRGEIAAPKRAWSATRRSSCIGEGVVPAVVNLIRGIAETGAGSVRRRISQGTVASPEFAEP
jgi:hypothetical protein